MKKQYLFAIIIGFVVGVLPLIFIFLGILESLSMIILFIPGKIINLINSACPLCDQIYAYTFFSLLVSITFWICVALVGVFAYNKIKSIKKTQKK